MFSNTPTSGQKVEAVSSWKLLSSSTRMSAGSLESIQRLRGMPIFPPTKGRISAYFTISPMRAVVVVFPLVPVTATVGRLTWREAGSSSPVISIPRLFAWQAVRYPEQCRG